MKVFITGLVLILGCWSCSSRSAFRKDKAAFDASPVLSSFKSIGDMNDSYFVIKDNRFFEFYKILYDSVKNSRYPGKYTVNGDTLLLHFYNKKGYTLLGHKALIEKNKKEIVFFDNFPGYKKRLLVN
jgi:hypothetical protein